MEKKVFVAFSPYKKKVSEVFKGSVRPSRKYREWANRRMTVVATLEEEGIFVKAAFNHSVKDEFCKKKGVEEAMKKAFYRLYHYKGEDHERQARRIIHSMAMSFDRDQHRFMKRFSPKGIIRDAFGIGST